MGFSIWFDIKSEDGNVISTENTYCRNLLGNAMHNAFKSASHREDAKKLVVETGISYSDSDVQFDKHTKAITNFLTNYYGPQRIGSITIKEDGVMVRFTPGYIPSVPVATTALYFIRSGFWRFYKTLDMLLNNYASLQDVFYDLEGYSFKNSMRVCAAFFLDRLRTGNITMEYSDTDPTSIRGAQEYVSSHFSNGVIKEFSKERNTEHRQFVCLQNKDGEAISFD